jgi:plastocyanin
MGTRSKGKTLVAAVVLALSAGSAAAQPQPGVTIQTFQFKPTPIEVPAGAKVLFTNGDDITHTVTSGTPESRDGKFNHQLAGKGATATVELTQPGVYPFFCDRHRSMRGEIRVK